MERYREAKIDQKVIAEYADNFYAKTKTCLKLADNKFYEATIIMEGHDHVWALTLLPKKDYPMLYSSY